MPLLGALQLVYIISLFANNNKAYLYLSGAVNCAVYIHTRVIVVIAAITNNASQYSSCQWQNQFCTRFSSLTSPL